MQLWIFRSIEYRGAVLLAVYIFNCECTDIALSLYNLCCRLRTTLLAD